jgi:ATP adenylyltransferase
LNQSFLSVYLQLLMDNVTNQTTLQLLQPGTLWAKTVERTETALACGALQPIATESNFIEQDGIRFLVRVLANLVRKAAARVQQAQRQDFNPFLPYDPDLFVADLSPTHVCLLNKYNVVDYHLLIITREFEAQETLLTQPDFDALWTCLAEIDGLGFYNSGKTAGASQPHKHLQLVPLPLVPSGDKIPIESALASAWNGVPDKTICQSPVLPFQHALMRWNHESENQAQPPAQTIRAAYQQLLTSLDLYDAATAQPKGPYNLLVTREWLLIVPRSQEQFASISVNSLGFAGTLFVRDQAQLEQLQAIEPLTLLKAVGVS